MINDNAFTADDVCDDNVFMMTLMNMLTLKTPSPNVNSDNYDGDFETFPRSTPDLLALIMIMIIMMEKMMMNMVTLKTPSPKVNSDNYDLDDYGDFPDRHQTSLL